MRGGGGGGWLISGKSYKRHFIVDSVQPVYLISNSEVSYFGYFQVSYKISVAIRWRKQMSNVRVVYCERAAVTSAQLVYRTAHK